MNFASTWNNLLRHWTYVNLLLMEGYETGALQKEPYIAPFVERFKNSFFGKVFMMTFASTWNNLLEHCISVDYLLMECYCAGCSTKGAVHWSFRRALYNSYYGMDFVTTWKNLPKHWIFADFLLIVRYNKAIYESSCPLLLS